MEDLYLFEIVDTGDRPAAADGQTGTSSSRRCAAPSPDLRLNTRDLGRIIATDAGMRRQLQAHGPLSSTKRRHGPHARRQHYPMACLTAVRSDERSTGEWLCVASGPRAAALSEKVLLCASSQEERESREGMLEHMERPPQGRPRRASRRRNSSMKAYGGVHQFRQRRQARRLLDLRRKT